jgi:xylulokinase
MANVLNVELVTVNTTEGAAFGAALLAGVGAGVWQDVDQACHETIKLTGTTAPEPKVVASYLEPYQRYRELYPALKDIFHKI